MSNRNLKVTKDLRARIHAVLPPTLATNHTACLALVRAFGYEAVSAMIDEALDPDLPKDTQRIRLQVTLASLAERARGASSSRPKKPAPP